MSLYSKRGVSAQKEEVHAATKNLDKGIFPNAFCKVYPDLLTNDPDWVNVMHADGAGTKSILAYLSWKETGNLDVWKGIAQDAIVMNLDDLLCVGIHDNFLFSSTIDRNKKLIPGEVLEAIITASQDFFNQMKRYDVNITYMGGETADVGDVVRTIAVNGTLAARWPKNKIITNDKIAPGNVIVGLAGFGKASYESTYNSGIGSNGLTSARHDILDDRYRHYTETYEPSLEADVVYIGKHSLQDRLDKSHGKLPLGADPAITVGDLILSPTRTFAPLLSQLLKNHFDKIKGLIHCSGGGQTKCLKYLPGPMRVIKDNLFEPPVIFNMIEEASGADAREMYQVYNMGTRMEIYCDENDADLFITIAGQFNIDARVIGSVVENDAKALTIQTSKQEELQFS